MKRTIALIGLCALLAPLGGRAKAVERILLAERGAEPAYTVVVREKASPSERYAAEELCTFLEKATGVRLPVVSDTGKLPGRAILLGATRFSTALLKNGDAKLGTDGFRLVVRGPHLLVVGSADRGVLYGVYEILERFAGCRWYASWHTVVPHAQRVAVPARLDVRQVPAFEMREPHWFDVVQHPEFAARLRVNSRSWRRTDAKFGGDPFRFGGELSSCHTFNTLLPPATYFDSHPKYFSLVNGVRVRDRTQLCLTNPDVLRLVTSNVLARIKGDSGAKFYGVSPNDNENYCRCPACAAIDAEEGSPAGTLVRFVNAVAEVVEKVYPDVVIETLAYNYTRRPPKKTRLRPNVVPCLCTSGCEYAFPLDESKFHEDQAFCADIVEWGRQTNFLYLWDYVTDFAHYTMPWPNVRSLRRNLAFFRRNNVRAVFSLGAYQGRHADFAELKAWLTAKWMWNPELPEKALLDDFFAGYYGKGAPFVRRYFERLHDLQLAYSRRTGAPLRAQDSVMNPAIPDAFLDEARTLWQKAITATAKDPATSYNVRMGAFSVDYLRMERGGKLLNLAKKPGFTLAADEMRTLAKSLLARMDEAGDICLAETSRDYLVQRWRELAAGFDRPQTATSGRVEDRFIGVMKKGLWGDVVADPKAGDGHALKLFGAYSDWCVQFPLSTIAFEPGRRYTLRLRVRVDKRRDGVAFRAGVFCTDNMTPGGSAAFTTDQTSDSYAWYDILTWEPKNNELIWIQQGEMGADGTSTVNDVFIDCLEFVEQP